MNQRRKEPMQREEDLQRLGDYLFRDATGFDGLRDRGHGPLLRVVGDLENHPSLSFTSLTRLPSCSRMRSSSPGWAWLAERMTRPSSVRLTMA